MRKKELKLIVTFHTTAAAMAMEQACKKLGVEGRLIPVPRTITAGCGLSWCTDLAEKEKIEQVLEEVGIERNAMHECMV